MFRLHALLLILPTPLTALSHLSLGSPRHDRHIAPTSNESEPEHDNSCSPLTNIQGTHYIISVQIGTPPQKFSLIPDTGSPWVIVADNNCTTACECNKHGGNHCFEDAKSSSLQLPRDATGQLEKHELLFGSGPISIAVGTDEVRIAGTRYHHRMEKGVLLMYDSRLAFTGPFEGLLGLSLPEYKLEQSVLDEFEAHSYQDGFLDKCGIKQFSICLSDKGWSGSGGALRFNAPSGKEKLGITERTMHWQVEFHGVSIGNTALNVCRDTAPGDKAPCAAIIDSGTTYMLGPQSYISQLYNDLCDQWPRCRNKFMEVMTKTKEVKKLLATRNDTGLPPYDWSKSQALQELLGDCNSWLGKPGGLKELPKLNFTLKGRSGNQDVLQLEPWDYVVAEHTHKMEAVYRHVGNQTYTVGMTPSKNKHWTCTPAFASMDFPTYNHGPAWIFGLPIFYSHVVSYDADTTPPSLSFKREKCGSCGNSHRSMQSGGLDLPRKMHGPPRLPWHAVRLHL